MWLGGRGGRPVRRLGHVLDQAAARGGTPSRPARSPGLRDSRARALAALSSTPVALRVDAAPVCGVRLRSAEALDIAGSNVPGQAIALVFGGSIRVQTIENGDV